MTVGLAIKYASDGDLFGVVLAASAMVPELIIHAIIYQEIFK